MNLRRAVSSFLALPLIFLATLLAWLIIEQAAPVPQPAPTPTLPAEEIRHPEIVSATSSAESMLTPPVSATSTEETKPPNLRPSAVGTLPVMSVADIGAIGAIAWHPGAKTLFMAVYEPDGGRAIWKLPPGGVPVKVLQADPGAANITVTIDDAGAVYAEWDSPPEILRSDDEGANWVQVLGGVGTFWQIATGVGDVRYGTLHEDNQALLYRSLDGGYSWSAWMDFQKILPRDAVQYDPADPRFRLRHLHGVIVEKNAILVGTGDVARYTMASTDNGATWKQVWDEGFTASTATSEGDAVLLAPDQLHSHGIVKLDLTTLTPREVWNPIPYGWAGFCYSMLDVGGFYYAGLHTEPNSVDSLKPKYGVIVSPDGELWYPLLTLGPVSQTADSSLWLAKGDGVVYVSISGTLYTLPPIDASWFRNKTPFPKPANEIIPNTSSATDSAEKQTTP